ncbi:zinc finger protein squeeze [Drosophila novamexicana]|uniref:zinc finger protein squeeze n=1 Tax=Drosophila novamexicana TaxID=47314 RepID=UPI0011E5F2FC|nr:zinc finger protein squeeze [Drosophila novamexicana]
MAELPTTPNGAALGAGGDYLHRSIDQLRTLSHLTQADLRTAQLVHEYKPFNISEFRQNVERLDYSLKNGLVQQQQQQQQILVEQQHQQTHQHDSDQQQPQQQQQQQLHHQSQLKGNYSAPSSPPTPTQLSEQQEQKYDPSRSPSRQQGSNGSSGSSPEDQRQGGEQTKPYKCASCSKSFANSSYLSQHTRIHLGIKPYRCEICQRKFTQLSHLQQHIRTHTGDKPYKCRHAGCPKAFSQLSNLQSHSRCHQTDKPFKCNSCYKCFGDEVTLLEHIPKHKDSKHLKTHICQLCGKSYTQETYLQKHLQKHAEKVEKQQQRHTAPLTNLQQHVPAGGIGLNLQRQAMNDANAAYWAKMGADSAAATLAEAIQQQLPQANGSSYANFATLQQQHQQQELLQQHHQRLVNGGTETPGHSQSPHDEVGEDLVLRQTTPQHHLQQQQQQQQQQQHQQQQQASHSHSPGPGTSAFTPLSAAVAPPASHLQQHRAPPSATAAYLYQQNAAAAAAAFPTQLISLHQIRNYAHQPGAGLIPSDHLALGLSAVAKEKAQ